MPNLASLLKSDTKPMADADRRLASRFLNYWESLRGSNGLPLISDLNFDVMGEFVPYAFNLDLTTGADDPKVCFLGRQLARECGGDITNQGISRLLPQSLLARAIERRGEVVSEGKPCLISDDYINAEGDKVLYRAVMMPFSTTGDTIDFIIGAINSKTVDVGRTAASPKTTSEAAGVPFKSEPTGPGTPQQEGVKREPGSRNSEVVAELVAEVSAAMCEETLPKAESGQLEQSPNLAIPKEGVTSPHGRIIVVGSEKGGTGKSTTAMHLIVSLLHDGFRVGCIDLDSPQSSLSRYITNRQTFNRQHRANLPCSSQIAAPEPGKGTGLLEEDLFRLASMCDFVVVDTPGSDSAISRMAHSWANIVITPINDSFVDLDMLAVLDSEGKQILKRGHYAEMVARARKDKIERTGEGFDWIVLRNRLSNLEARNKNRVADALEVLAQYLEFRNGPGFSERVIYRELFLKGLTLLDLHEKRAGVVLSMSHVAARQELRTLLQSIGISEEIGAKQVRAAAR
jgi:chromosome partitioning protein